MAEKSKIKIKKTIFSKPSALKITIEEDSKVLGWVYLYLIYSVSSAIYLLPVVSSGEKDSLDILI